MSIIPNKNIDFQSVKNFKNLSDYVGQFIELKKQGSGYVGLCPFHDDHNPSFTTYRGDDGTERYRCFACGADGDVIDFCKDINNVNTLEAVRILKGDMPTEDDQVYKPISTPRTIKTITTQQPEKDMMPRDKAQALWDRGKHCKSHPYTDRKGVELIGLRVLDGNLLVPVFDDDWQIISVQIIQPDGTKRFMKGCKMAGGRFAIGKVTDNTLVIAEGYATAASIHQATGLCVAVAFSSGNLPKVAALARKKKPELKIILAPDNDQ